MDIADTPLSHALWQRALAHLGKNPLQERVCVLEQLAQSGDRVLHAIERHAKDVVDCVARMYAQCIAANCAKKVHACVIRMLQSPKLQTFVDINLYLLENVIVFPQLMLAEDESDKYMSQGIEYEVLDVKHEMTDPLCTIISVLPAAQGGVCVLHDVNEEELAFTRIGNDGALYLANVVLHDGERTRGALLRDILPHDVIDAIRLLCNK